MSARIKSALRVSLTLFIIASPLVTHFALTADQWGATAYALILGQTALGLWSILTRIRQPYKYVAAMALLGCSLTLSILHLQSGLVLSSGLPHALVNLVLLIVFGLSLRPGRIPTITALSHQIHGDLPPRIDRYTRRVTWAWCLFFLLQLAGSALLMAFAPVAWWSFFVNVLNAPLIAVLFVGEMLTRSFWVTNPPHERLADMVQMVAWVGGKLKKRDHRGLSARES
jgi:uncharacterized membrane protein